MKNYISKIILFALCAACSSGPLMAAEADGPSEGLVKFALGSTVSLGFGYIVSSYYAKNHPEGYTWAKRGIFLGVVSAIATFANTSLKNDQVHEFVAKRIQEDTNWLEIFDSMNKEGLRGAASAAAEDGKRDIIDLLFNAKLVKGKKDFDKARQVLLRKQESLRRLIVNVSKPIGESRVIDTDLAGLDAFKATFNKKIEENNTWWKSAVCRYYKQLSEKYLVLVERYVKLSSVLDLLEQQRPVAANIPGDDEEKNDV